jgi:hypothetical protein
MKATNENATPHGVALTTPHGCRYVSSCEFFFASAISFLTF